MSSELKANTLDDRRRLVLPECFPAGCAVIVHQLDSETVIVSRAKKDRRLCIVDLAGSAGVSPAGGK